MNRPVTAYILSARSSKGARTRLRSRAGLRLIVEVDVSHVTEMKVVINDLDALKAACAALGLEFLEGKQTYKWYGYSVGDTPIPTGYTVEDLGHCVHAIRVKGDAGAYEVGVVERRDGQPGFGLMADEWQRGYGLLDIVGKGCGRLIQEYGAQRAIKAAQRQGLRVVGREVKANGRLQLVFQEA